MGCGLEAANADGTFSPAASRSALALSEDLVWPWWQNSDQAVFPLGAA